MRILTHRLQVLVDADRHTRLVEEARRRKVSVGLLARDAIDATYPVSTSRRQQAFARILATEPIPVPEADELKAELDQIRAGGL